MSNDDELDPVPEPHAPTIGQLSAEDLITLNEEIAAMARAGLPLDQGLTALASEMKRGKLQQVTRQIADDLKAGFSLPDALKRQEGHVPAYYAALLAAGIRSGKLGEVLATLTLYARSVADFRDTVSGALIYPGIILIVGMMLFVFVSAAIIPTYASIFDQMKLQLPVITRMLFFVAEHMVAILIPTLVLIVGGIAVERLWLRGNPSWVRIVYAMPVIGTLIRSARLAAFADLLGILVDQAVPLPEALRLAATASSDPLLNRGAEQIENNLRQGMPLGDALHRQRLVPKLVVWMIGFGERQGTLGAALHQLAQMYRRQSEARAGLVRTVLPPLLILLLSLTLGAFFIFGLYTPLFELLDGLSGGGRKK